MEQKKEKVVPAMEIKITIGINEYPIKFPKNSSLIDIESAKIRMTGGTSKDMVYGGASGQRAYLTVEAIATFEVLIPSLSKDLLVPSLLDLNMQQSQSILKAYEKYYEWMKEWREFLNEDVEKEEEEKK